MVIRMDKKQRRAQRDWCILRTSGGRTISLANSLAAVGMDVWTPRETRKCRSPRSKDLVDREIAIMPTFVFARAPHVAEFYHILSLPMNPHPSFSVFRHMGKIPLLDDRDMRSLREAEENAKRRLLRKERHDVPIGTAVKLEEGAFAGLAGVVKESNGKFALVCFGGAFEVQIASFLIRTDAVPDQTSDAALAA